MEYARNVRLADLVANKGPVIHVYPNTTIEETSRVLQRNKITAAPVWDEEEKKYIAIIDVFDLMTYAVMVGHVEAKDLLNHHQCAQLGNFPTPELQRLTFKTGTVRDILNFPGSERRKTYVFHSNAKLENAMKILGQHDYRVLVVHYRKPFFSVHRLVAEYKILTQSDILKWFAGHVAKLQSTALGKPVDRKYANPVLSITPRHRAIDGFLRMLDAGSSACAVLDDSGRLVGHLSASDLRGVTSENLNTISLPVLQFLAKVSPGRPNQLITCSTSDSYLDAMMRILKARVHQCWMLGTDNTPVGCLTMSKIILIVLGFT